MPTPSANLGLLVPSDADPFSTADIAGNWTKVDGSPGPYKCTSSTRPSWGANQNGRLIFETDTLLLWRWSNQAAQFRRLNGTGILKQVGGTFAIGQRTSDFSTTATSGYQVVVPLGNVVVPDGLRPLEIIVSYQSAYNTVGPFLSAIYRSVTGNTGPQTAQWKMAQGPGGGSLVGFISGGLAAGTYDFSFQIVGLSGGTSTISASIVTPTTITVVEL